MSTSHCPQPLLTTVMPNREADREIDDAANQYQYKDGVHHISELVRALLSCVTVAPCQQNTDRQQDSTIDHFPARAHRVPPMLGLSLVLVIIASNHTGVMDCAVTT